MVKGQVKENESVVYQKWVGIESFKVLKFNPDKEELETLLGTEIEKEPEYVKEDKEGNPMASISVWVEGSKSGDLFNIRFNLIDKDRVSKSGKTQYINSVGLTSYTDDTTTFQKWFNNFTDKNGSVIGEKKVRVAKVGEEEFYSFLRAWLYRLDYYNPTTELIVDFKKLIKGNVSELESLRKSEFSQDKDGNPTEFVGVAIVRSVEKDGEVKQYQGISTKAFLPGSYMKYVNNGNFPKNLKKSWDKFKESFEGEHGEKAFHSLELIHEYDGSEDMTSGNSTKREISEEGSDY